MCFSLLLSVKAQVYKKERDKRTPFDKVEYKNNRPFIEVDKRWVEVVEIANIPIDTLLRLSAESSPNDWKKGFHRYLDYHLDDLGIVRDDSIKVCYKIDNEIFSKYFTLEKGNRDKATAYHEKNLGNHRILRDHKRIAGSNFDYLKIRLDSEAERDESWITPEQAIHDLEYLEWEIQQHYSYAELTGFDYRSAVDFIIQELGDGISTRDFAMQLKLLMANFGDGHSRVSLSLILKDEDKKRLPFVIIEHDGRFFAIDPESKNYFCDAYPEVISIGGVLIDSLYSLAKQIVAKTTSKFQEKESLAYLQVTSFLLKWAGVEIGAETEVVFGGERSTLARKLALERHPNTNLKKRHYLHDSILNDDIGYLAMNKLMDADSSFISSLHLAMKKFEQTAGLIIDIRGNGGGYRDPLRALLPYFIRESKIVNVGQYRIDQEEDFHPRNGYLMNRYMYPRSYTPGILDSEDVYLDKDEFINATDTFMKAFKPSVHLDRTKYSEFHFMVVSPARDRGQYYYDKPVIVLVDEACFSAADIFAAGIRQGDDVRLLGNTTGGGSGYAKSKILPHSKIKVRLSRMFSFQADGSLYDGHGVIPDIHHEYILDDKIGITDSQLQKAISLLKE